MPIAIAITSRGDGSRTDARIEIADVVADVDVDGDGGVEDKDDGEEMGDGTFGAEDAAVIGEQPAAPCVGVGGAEDGEGGCEE